MDHWRRVALEQAYLEELKFLPSSAVGRTLPDPRRPARDRPSAGQAVHPRAHNRTLLNRLDGLGHAEIAEQLGVSVPRVRQYIAQGLRQCYIALYGEPT